jgi:hypothetical protein
MKQRFILIDQSIQHLGGHHYEYAVRVLEAAERAGLEPILVTNRQVSVGAHTRFRVVPAYLYAFWDHPRRFSLVRRLAALFRVRANALDRFKFRLLFSPVGIAYIERERLLDWLRRRSFSHDVSSFSRIAILSVAGVIKLLQTILGTLKLLMPFQSYFSRVFSVLGRIPRSMVSLGSQLRSRLGAPEFMGMSARKVRQFRKDTLRLMSLIGAHPGDCFFVPTLNEAEMLGLADPVRRSPAGTTWHLLFRRNLYSGRDWQYADQDEALRPYRNAFKRFQRSVPAGRVRFYTDTEPLTVQYNRLQVASFTTLPIPVSAAFRVMAVELPSAAGPTLLYAGDARTEKGFHFLPRLVEDLRATPSCANARFLFQANFNVPGGEPRPAVAKAELRAMEGPALRLVDQPLTSDGYCSLFHQADAALVLYDADNYYARSSGVHVEALTAGMPVVIPAASWMWSTVGDAFCDYHAALLASPRVRAAPPVNWRFHGSERTDARAAGRLVIRGGAPSFAWLRPEPGDDHLILTGRLPEGTVRFVRVFVDFLSREGDSLRQSVQIVGGLQSGRISALLRVPPGAQLAWLGLSDHFADTTFMLDDLDIHYLCTGRPLPLGVVASVYTGEGEITAAARELVEHFDHYRQSASRFSHVWSAYHSPEGVVSGIMASLQPPPSNERELPVRPTAPQKEVVA